jgi:hypothetical protein
MDKQTRRRHHTRYPGAGHKQSLGKSVIKKLKTFYDNKRMANESVGTLHLKNEACKIDPTNLETDDNALCMCIYQLFKHWNFTYRRATCKTQNTVYCLLETFKNILKTKLLC